MERREGMALSGSASYHLNGSGSSPHGGLPPPPGFELPSNPNVSVHSHVRVSSMETSFQVEEQNPSPNYTHGIDTAVKRKRGRPRKYMTLAPSPMSSKVTPGSSTPTRKRSKGRLQRSGKKQQLASLVSKEKEDCKRAHGETVLRPCASEKEGIDKILKEMNNIALKERYEECTKRVLELETELQDAKIRLEISKCQADKILLEKEEKISELQAANSNLAAELFEARRTIKFFENASKESSKFENFGLKETPEVGIISSPCKVKDAKERDSRFMEREDSGVFIWQDKNMTISSSDTESPPRNNQISNNEVKSPAPQPQSLGSSEEVPHEISSSTVETKPIVDQFSRLQPLREQSPSDLLPPGLLEQSMDLVGRVQSFLAEQLTSTTTSDLNKMIDLANKAFATLDWCRADYRSFHCDVGDFIRCRSDRLSAEEERNGHAYSQIVSWHKDLLNQSNDAEEALSNAKLELRSAIEKLEPLKNEIVMARDLLRQLEKEMADKELKIEDLKGKRDSCDNAFSNAEMEAKKMWWRRREIDERVKAAVEGDEKMKDRLRSYILSGQNK
ncbi:hypothetical protein LguiB_034679 [Lonicera macranthoides]